MTSEHPPSTASGRDTLDDLPENILAAYYQATGQDLRQALDATAATSRALRAANYIRLSKEDESAHSLDTQPDLSRIFIVERGWRLVGTYADPDHTGRNSKRPDLQRLIRDIKAGQIDVVVVHRLDRLYRNLEALLRFIRLLKRYHVQLISVSENIDLDNDWGYLVIYVLGGLAEYYVRNLSRRTLEGKLTRVKKGLLNGSFRFGYCNGSCSKCADPNGPDYCPRVGQPNVGEGKVLIPHPVESIAVRLAFEWYAQGDVSDLDIAQRLNDYDYLLPDGSAVHFRTKGKPGQSQPGPFTRDNVRDILTNVVYAGVAAHYPSRPLSWDEDDPAMSRVEDLSRIALNRRIPDYVQKGQHQPLVSWSLYEQCRQIRRRKGKSPQRQQRAVRVYPLSGIARCWPCSNHDGCGVPLRGISSNGGTRYYRCATLIDRRKQRGTSRPPEETGLPPQVTRATPASSKETMGCIAKAVHAEVLEEQVYTLVRRLRIPGEWRERILAYYLSDDGMQEFERQRYNLAQAFKHSTWLLKSGVISQAEFEEEKTRFTQRMARLKPDTHVAAASALGRLDDWAWLWEQMTPEEHKGLLQTMLAGAYFDGPRLIKLVANAPFDRWLGGSEGGPARAEPHA